MQETDRLASNCARLSFEAFTHCVRTRLGCKFRNNEFNDLAKTLFRFLQLICEIKCKNRRLVPTLIASR